MGLSPTQGSSFSFEKGVVLVGVAFVCYALALYPLIHAHVRVTSVMFHHKYIVWSQDAYCKININAADECRIGRMNSNLFNAYAHHSEL